MSPDRPRRGPISRITSAAAGAIDVNAIVDSIDVNQVASRLDVDALVDRIDPEALVDRIDPDRLLDRVDVNAVLDRVDVNALLDRVEPDRLLDRVDPDRLLDRVGPDRLLDRIDANALLDRVDADRLLERVDVDAVVDRVDVNALVDKIDVNRLIDRVDINAVVDRAGISEIVGESTGQVAGSLLDVLRRQVVALDEIVGRVAFRLVRRDPKSIIEGPPLLVGHEASTDTKGRGLVSGHYAGPISRLLAFALDVAVVFGVYTLVTAGLAFFYTGLLNLSLPEWSGAPWVAVLILATWAFLYYWLGQLIAGRSLGMSVVGLRVVTNEGAPVRPRQALIRTLVLPVSILALGLGLLGIPFGRRRQAWHDKVSRTSVVFDWGDRKAKLPAPLTRWINERSP